MLKGRLGLETARVPHVDRHGLIWLDHGILSIEDGCLRFVTAGGVLDKGDYRIPHQGISVVLLGPGSSVTHDALRLLARHGTALVAIGDDGTRCYSAPPLLPNHSILARKQVMAWADPDSRLFVARRMYAWRLGELTPSTSIEALRGIEGARMKETYKLIAHRFGIPWKGRRFDRSNPSAADLPNQAINHVVTAVEAAATIAVYATGTIPTLGFIHEDPASSFILDVTDLFRDTFTLPIAFESVVRMKEFPAMGIERMARRLAGERFRRTKLIHTMIDRIKELFDGVFEDPSCQ